MLEESWLRSETSKATTGRKIIDWDPPTKNTKLNKTGTIAQAFPPGWGVIRNCGLLAHETPVTPPSAVAEVQSLGNEPKKGFPCGSFKGLPVALMWLEKKDAGIFVAYKQAFDSLFPMARSQLSWVTSFKSLIHAILSFMICTSVLTQCKLPSLLPQKATQSEILMQKYERFGWENKVLSCRGGNWTSLEELAVFPYKPCCQIVCW